MKETEGDEFVVKLMENITEKVETEEATLDNTCVDAVRIAKEELGVSRGGKYFEKESWRWNSEVQDVVREKKEAFKCWKTAGREEDQDQDLERIAEEEYRKKNKKAKV